MPLLTTQNHKTVKGEKFGYKTYILYMAPNTLNGLGVNLCPMATEGCKKACLYTAGMGKFGTVKSARTKKAIYFIKEREKFLMELYIELSNISKKHKLLTPELKPAVRLNGTTDIQWENYKVVDGKNLFELFPDITFYDYTKIPNRYDKGLPKNYHLVFSYTGEETHIRHNTIQDVSKDILSKGYNVSVVFRNKLPESFLGYPVVNGDETDLRFRDGSGVIIGLKAKGDAKKDTSGFVVDI